ncbi:MAG: DUF5717 family protein [Clostridiales bacterium]|jgi:hypothetical protein|nr:DUF5717 family protein [Clostridiales bacterium]
MPGEDKKDREISVLEMRVTRYGTVRSAVLLTLRCWLEWRINGGDRNYLNKANHTAVVAHRKNDSDIRLFMLVIFISIEAERFDAANEMLDKAMSYKAHLRNNEPLYYALLCFLYAYLEIKQKRARSAKKHMRALQDFVKATGSAPVYDLLLGMLHLGFYEFDEAFAFLTAAFDGGCRSVFLYQSLYHYYLTSVRGRVNHTLLPVLHWASARKADITDIVSVYQDELHAAIADSPVIGERIYAANPQSAFILREICAGRMLAGDFGREAFAYYREAEHKQIYINGLYQFIIKAAYTNRSERVSHYTMKEYLKVSDETDPGMKVYVYHLLLTDPALSDLVPERKNDILQLSAYCLESNMTGREVNSLYYFFWCQCREMGISGENTDKAEALLFADLTRFEAITDAHSETRALYINERERKGMAVYELESGRVTVNAVDSTFNYTCLNAGRKHIINERLTVRRMITRADPALYRYFFRKGARDFPLLAHLANNWLTLLDENNAPEAMPPEDISEAIQVLEAALGHKEIAKPYLMRIRVALGGLCYRAGKFDKALEYYGGVDENELDNEYVEQILSVFLQTREWSRAAGLVMRKKRFISNKALFGAIKKLSAPEYDANHPHLADAAYDLLLDQWYDPDLLRIVLLYYRGGQSEWQALSRALSALNVTAAGLDEIIIKNSIWMHQFDEDAQKAFVRLVNEPGGVNLKHPLVEPFVEYCAYEMILNDVRPDYDTLVLLERIYLNDKSPLLSWALCHVYLRNGINTFNSEDIWEDAVASQEEAQVLFPVFREYRDKYNKHPYIEKNQPFLYQSLPEKNVWLHYKIDDAPAFQAKPMRYLRFGLYLTSLSVFYGEKVTYYFSEEMASGSITTREDHLSNTAEYLYEKEGDPFFTINNALIYEKMFKHEQVERIINGLVKDVRMVRGAIV